MEAFLLNPGTPAKNPASQQNVSTMDNGEGGEFSPVMDQAVTSLENTNNPNNESTESGTFETTSTDDTAILADETVFAIDNPQTNPAEILLSMQGALTTTPQANPDQSQIANQAQTVSLAQVTNQSQPVGLAQIADQTQQQALANIAPEESSSAIIPNHTSPAPVATTNSESSIPPVTKAETVLLQQIQQILNQGKNDGSITITANTVTATNPLKSSENLQNLSSPILNQAETNELQARQVGLAGLTPKEATPVSQNSSKLDGAHQDVTEQYYNAKMGESKTGNNGNFQNNNSEQKGTEQQNKSEIQPSTNQTAGNSISDTKPGESSFGLQLSSSSQTTVTPTPIEGKLAPGVHTPVPEKEMVNNLIQRFNVNPRLQTSKLTMQLHPAELGSLKIDILVKGDSINANIVAQSQQVLETLEKQMPRLRTVLQEQGFTIDSFEITMESDGGNQKDFFQEHFSSDQQQFASNESSSQQNDSFESLLDQQNESDENDDDTTGVNVTV